jgi:hypothetical protein
MVGSNVWSHAEPWRKSWQPQSASAWRAQARKKRGLIRAGENTDNCVDAAIHSKWAKLEILEPVFEKKMEGRLLHDMGLSLEYQFVRSSWG